MPAVWGTLLDFCLPRLRHLSSPVFFFTSGTHKSHHTQFLPLCVRSREFFMPSESKDPVMLFLQACKSSQAVAECRSGAEQKYYNFNALKKSDTGIFHFCGSEFRRIGIVWLDSDPDLSRASRFRSRIHIRIHFNQMNVKLNYAFSRKFSIHFPYYGTVHRSLRYR